jgi:hypothetical protein
VPAGTVGENRVMKGVVETDPVLVLVDMLIDDLAVGSARFVGRRAEDGDGQSFVLEGRRRGTAAARAA